MMNEPTPRTLLLYSLPGKNRILMSHVLLEGNSTGQSSRACRDLGRESNRSDLNLKTACCQRSKGSVSPVIQRVSRSHSYAVHWQTKDVMVMWGLIIIGESCHRYEFCRDKTARVCRNKTRLLSQSTKVCLLRQHFCRDKTKHTFVATKLSILFVATKLLSRSKCSLD